VVTDDSSVRFGFDSQPEFEEPPMTDDMMNLRTLVREDPRC
jgi:hypothetical protein